MSKLSLIVPSFGTHPDNLRRTIESCKSLCDETIVISTSFFVEDKKMFAEMADKVVQLEWNHVFKHGFGDMMNHGTAISKNDWLILLGVAETFAEPFEDIQKLLDHSPASMMFRCSHHNDTNLWKRIWNKNGGVNWSGLIHEELYGGSEGPVIFRFQDTYKTPKDDPTKNEILRWLKALSYNACYKRLLEHPSELGATNAGWLKFVEGSKEAIMSFCEEHKDLMEPCMKGDQVAFLQAIDVRMEKDQRAIGVNYAPQGGPTTV